MILAMFVRLAVIPSECYAPTSRDFSRSALHQNLSCALTQDQRRITNGQAYASKKEPTWSSRDIALRLASHSMRLGYPA